MRKLCECRCGKPTTIPNYNNFSQGTIKGVPRRFVTGHNVLKGRKLSEETKKKLSLQKLGTHLSQEHKVIAVKNLIPGQKTNLGKKLPQQTCLKMSVSRKGNNHWNWQGGISSINTRIRQSREAKQWRKGVYERDNYTCQHCGKRGGELNVDHIKPFAYFPELRFEVSNGRTLCVACHRKTFMAAGKMKEIYGI